MTEPAQVSTKEELEQVQIQEMAKLIKNEKQLKKIILAARADMRQLVYEQILPHLKFAPRAYRMLIRH